MHTHTHTYIYIYRERERERGIERGIEQTDKNGYLRQPFKGQNGLADI